MAELEEEEDRSAVIAHFQEITGVEGDVESVEALSAHGWNLEAAVQATLNRRDPPPVPPPPALHPSPPPLAPQDPTSTAVRTHNIRRSDNAVAERGGWLQWISSLTLFPLRFVVSTSAEILNFLVQLLFGSNPRPASQPRGDVATFLAELEADHGTTHPDLLQCSYAEALNDARQQLRFLLVYLHSPHHQDSPHFCRQRRDTDKRLREEQDRAFAASLEADKAKKREREQQEAEERMREAEEREREQLEQRKEEEFAEEVRQRRSRLPLEPDSSSDPASLVFISLRLPSGERLERRFNSRDQLQSLYDFAYTSDSVPRRFTLVTNFPKRELCCAEDGGPSLGELSLGPKSVVFMKNDSD